MLLTFVTTMINRLLTKKEEIEQLKAWQREIADWTSDLNRARRTGDKKLLKKVQKREKRIKQIQSKVASQSLKRMKTMPIFMGLFVFVWLLLTGRILLPFIASMEPLFDAPFSGGETVAYLPWFGDPMPLTLFLWYMICSMAFGILFSRVFGLTPGATE